MDLQHRFCRKSQTIRNNKDVWYFRFSCFE